MFTEGVKCRTNALECLKITDFPKNCTHLGQLFKKNIYNFQKLVYVVKYQYISDSDSVSLNVHIINTWRQ